HGLPGHREVLADPSLRVAQPVRLLEHLHVPAVGFAERAPGRMARHQEEAELHTRIQAARARAASRLRAANWRTDKCRSEAHELPRRGLDVAGGRDAELLELRVLRERG